MDLGVWREAVQLAVLVYKVTQRYPIAERHELTSQTRRAAVSISSNIAEGKGRSSHKETGWFIDIAIGSLFELQSQLEVAVALGFIKAGDVRNVSPLIEKLERGLTKLKLAQR